MYNNIIILHDRDLDRYLANLDVASILEQTFAALDKGLAVQPGQTLTLFPENGGDCIAYLGVLSNFGVFGVKLSPYIPTGGKPIITAWTLLMSMRSGLPLQLCDSGRLTTARTAATTALAVDKLGRPDSRILAVIGSGAIAKAHIQQALPLRDWSEIRVFSPNLANNPGRQTELTGLDKRLRISSSAAACVNQADVVMLATSSGQPVINLAEIGKNALITSISTNVAKAHEIDPAQLPELDVYCDYKATTPGSAGEMVLAAESGVWSQDKIRGDLAGLCAGTAPLPDYARPVFFRSIGLGLEDVAIAYAIYKQISG